jgi:hypothetical protein
MQKVYVNKEGKFLIYSEFTSHTGTHKKVNWTDDINEATVFSCMPHHLGTMCKEKLVGKEVRVKREVTIVGS